jgi:hypothetical protein
MATTICDGRVVRAGRPGLDTGGGPLLRVEVPMTAATVEERKL